MVHLSVLALLASLAGCSGVAPGTHPTSDAAPPTRSLLIVHDEALADSADRWAEHRRGTGWRVRRFAVDSSRSADLRRDAIRTRILDEAEASGPGELAVLLLGDAEALPPFYFEQTDETLLDGGDPRVATDHPYQQIDADDVPDVALGRVPARRDAEAMVLLEKIRRAEQPTELGPWRRRIFYAAGEGGFGWADHLLETLFRQMIDKLVPDAYHVEVAYAKPESPWCPPPSELAGLVRRRLSGDALLFNYVGHGSAGRLDRLHWAGGSASILTRTDVERLTTTTSGSPIAILTCCSAGYFDLPQGETSIAEAMLWAPGGPTAVIAGSRPTHPYANIFLQKECTRTLLIDRVATVGQLDLLAMRRMLEVDDEDAGIDMLAAPIALMQRWPTGLRALRRQHVSLYNLLGDPAQSILLPELLELRLDDGTLSGHAPAMTGGRALITAETLRRTPARASALIEVVGRSDPDLERKAAHNYPIANDPVVRSWTVTVTDGHFRVDLPTLGDEVAVIRVYVWGLDVEGRETDGVGAIDVE